MSTGPEKRMPEEHPTSAYATALAALRAARVPHVVGGGLAIQHYGRRRSTKDLDLFVRAQDVEAALNALAAAGFTAMDTDAAWLRKAIRGDAHIDLVVYSMGSIPLADEEIERSLLVELDGVPMRIFRPEDLLVRKIYLIRDEGPDWHDAFSILESEGAKLDWTMLERDDLDPRPLAGFLLVADARVPGFIPPHVLTRHLRRAGLLYDHYAQLHLPDGRGGQSEEGGHPERSGSELVPTSEAAPTVRQDGQADRPPEQSALRTMQHSAGTPPDPGEPERTGREAATPKAATDDHPSPPIAPGARRSRRRKAGA